MAGQEGFEPPTPGFGDRCSSQAELLAYPGLGPGLPGFLVNRVLPATGAELLPLHAVGVQAFVLRVRVVALLAFVASERDRITHGSPPFLLQDFRHDAGAHGPAALANREPKLLLHRDRRDQLHRDVHVVPRHHHLPALRQRPHSRHVRRPEIELRPVPIEERRVPPPPLPWLQINPTPTPPLPRDSL